MHIKEIVPALDAPRVSYLRDDGRIAATARLGLTFSGVVLAETK